MKPKEISKGIGVTLMTRVVVVGILLLANYGSVANNSLNPLPRDAVGLIAAFIPVSASARWLYSC